MYSNELWSSAQFKLHLSTAIASKTTLVLWAYADDAVQTSDIDFCNKVTTTPSTRLLPCCLCNVHI